MIRFSGEMYNTKELIIVVTAEGIEIDGGDNLQTDSDGDGALGGMATSAPLINRLTLKPPSSIAKEQITLNLSTGEQSSLNVKGRHDPVLGPRAVPIAEATVKLVISDMLQRCTKDE